MNILLTTDVFPPGCGGSGWSTFYLARSLQKAGVKVRVLTLQTNLKGIIDDDFRGIQVTRCGRYETDSFVSRLLNRRKSLKKFSELIETMIEGMGSAHLVHAAHMLSAKATLSAIENSGKKIPFVLTVRDYWPICVYSTMIYDGKQCTKCIPGRFKKCFAEYNKEIALISSLVGPSIKNEMKNRYELLRSADRIVFVSEYLSNVIRNEIPNLDSEVIYNGVDLEYIKDVLQNDATVNIKKPYLLVISKLELYKGADIIRRLIDDARLNIPIVIIGEGSERNRLIETADRNRKKAVFLNWQGNDEVIRIMKNGLLLLFPSIWNEPLSRVLLEAVAVGLPVVAMRSGGTPNIIEDKKNGVLYRTGDDFINGVFRLIDDRAKLKNFSSTGRRIAFERFNQEKITKRWITMYDEVIRQKTS
jgi:glycosyltransferase involved in cell wall biosynthesis